MKIKIKSDKHKIKPNRIVKSKDLDIILEKIKECEKNIKELYKLMYGRVK